MLPSHIYESLPYLYLALALGSIAASGFDAAVVVCASVLITASALILRMRRSYRRSLRHAGLSKRH